ncbi:MAG: hypothetical protein WCP29_09940 [Acidobacteriota bacterium]
MPVTIGELTTEVIAEADTPAGDATAHPRDPSETAGLRAELAALLDHRVRTRAEGFDD